MLSATNSWTPYIAATALAVTLFGIFVWKQKKKYVRVGKISKLLFYPVKSMKGIEVTKGVCTKYGFEVNGLLDRAFMVVDENGNLVSQWEAPSICLFTPCVSETYLIIQSPKGETLKVEIKKAPSQEDKKINCRIDPDITVGTDCGDEAATWLQSCLNMEGVRLVRFFHDGTDRKYTKKNPIFQKLRKQHPDSWKYMKFSSGAELLTIFLTNRCIATTNDPETGVFDKKEPLISMRKFRIPADPEILKITGSKPCLGTTCSVISCGEIEVGNEILAVVGKPPEMRVK